MNTRKLSFLVYGDVFGKIGRTAIQESIGTLKKKYNPTLTIANIENMTHGSGFSAKTVNELMDAGVDYFTGGDHSLDNRLGREVLNMKHSPVIRPANMKTTTGIGHLLIEVDGMNILLINMLGRLFMRKEFMHTGYANPFKEIDTILKGFSGDNIHATLVDFHAETTSEKAAFAHYLDGKVSLVYGTHTHVQTADERILPNGTGFISDLGFNGPLDSVIGIGIPEAVHNFKSSTPKKTHVVEHGRKQISALYVEINPKTARATHIQRINYILD
jgi:metallophosphoesterase (TIGR00282 family)